MINSSVYAVRRITELRHNVNIRMLSNALFVFIFVTHIMFKFITTNKKLLDARKIR